MLSTEQFNELKAKFNGVTALKTYFEGIRGVIDAKLTVLGTSVTTWLEGAEVSIHAVHTVHVDPDANASTADGSLTHPYKLIADALTKGIIKGKANVIMLADGKTHPAGHDVTVAEAANKIYLGTSTSVIISGAQAESRSTTIIDVRLVAYGADASIAGVTIYPGNNHSSSITIRYCTVVSSGSDKSVSGTGGFLSNGPNAVFTIALDTIVVNSAASFLIEAYPYGTLIINMVNITSKGTGDLIRSYGSSVIASLSCISLNMGSSFILSKKPIVPPITNVSTNPSIYRTL